MMNDFKRPGFKKSSEFAKIGQKILDCNYFWNFQKYALEVFSEQDKLISVTSMANETCATVVPEAMAAEVVAVVGNYGKQFEKVLLDSRDRFRE